ncbi:MAG: hypothetical protein JSR78_10390, partial [Proteobacteria bacterium]|nr:hypothetical protein [Pseudomonadota bacterium]
MLERFDDYLDDSLTVEDALIKETTNEHRSESGQHRQKRKRDYAPKNGSQLAPASCESLIAGMRPGDTDYRKRRVIAKIAAGPVSHAFAELRHWHAQTIQQIQKTSTSPEQLRQRLKDHGEFGDWIKLYEEKRQSWLRKKGITLRKGDARANLLSVDDARAQIERLQREILLKHLAYHESADDLVVKPAPPIDVLKVPAGIGKTLGAIKVASPDFIGEHSAVWLSERVSLSKQTVDDYNEMHGIDVAFWRSRKFHCKSQTFGKIAERAEEAGRSPQSVCAKCDKRSKCDFIKQGSELRFLTFGQTAHALKKFQKQKIDSLIFDESPFGVLTDHTVSTIDLARIAELKKHAKYVNKEGHSIISVEADRRAFLEDVLAVLRMADSGGNIAISTLRLFAAEWDLTLVKKDGSRKAVTQRRIVTCIATLSGWRNDVGRIIDAAVAALADKPPRTKRRELNAEISNASRVMAALIELMRIAQVFQDNILTNAPRTRVLGVKVFDDSEGRTTVKIMRKPDAPSAVRNNPLFVFDATGSETHYRALFTSGAAREREI